MKILYNFQMGRVRYRMGKIQAIKNSLGNKRYLLPSMWAGIVGTYRWLQTSLPKDVAKNLPDIPAWEFAIGGVFLIVMYFFVCRLQVLETNLEPKLKLEFKPTNSFISETTNSIHVSNPKLTIKLGAIYVRVRLSSTGLTPVHGCSVRLKNIEKLHSEDEGFCNTTFDTEQKLTWAGAGNRDSNKYDERTLRADNHYFVDVFSSEENSNALKIEVETQLDQFQDLFQSYGMYRFTIIANSNETGPAEKIFLLIDWKGQWNQVNVSLEE